MFQQLCYYSAVLESSFVEIQDPWFQDQCLHVTLELSLWIMFTTDYLEATLIRGFEIPKVLLQKMTSLTNKLNVWSWNKSPFPSICIHLQKVLVISCKPIDLVYGMEKTITF